MKRKLAFIRLIWYIAKSKGDNGWVFCKLSKETQEHLIRGSGGEIDLNWKYINADRRAIEKLVGNEIEEK